MKLSIILNSRCYFIVMNFHFFLPFLKMTLTIYFSARSLVQFNMHEEFKQQGAWLRTGGLGFDRGVGVVKFFSFLRVQTGPGVHSASYEMSTGGFPRE